VHFKVELKRESDMRWAFLNSVSRTVLLSIAASALCVAEATAQANPERNAYFGQTHQHTS
jgi:hypothetical protein